MDAVGVTFVIAGLAKSPASLCVGDVGLCVPLSCDDDIPIILFIRGISLKILRNTLTKQPRKKITSFSLSFFGCIQIFLFAGEWNNNILTNKTTITILTKTHLKKEAGHCFPYTYTLDMLKDNDGFNNRFEPVSVCHFGIFHFADF